MTVIDRPVYAERLPAPAVDDLTATNAARKRRRRRLVRWSAVPALLVVAVAAGLLFTTWATGRGIDAYDAGADDADRSAGALEWFDRASWLDAHEQEIAPFDRGDTLFRLRDFEGARAAFEQAYELADGDRRCIVVVNLVLTLETQGDALAAVDQLAAQPSYADAVEVIEENPGCLALTTPENDGAGDRLERVQERLLAKILLDAPNQTRREPRNLPSEAEAVDPDQSDVDELERRMEKNADARSRGREIDEGEDRGRPTEEGPSW